MRTCGGYRLASSQSIARQKSSAQLRGPSRMSRLSVCASASKTKQDQFSKTYPIANTDLVIQTPTWMDSASEVVSNGSIDNFEDIQLLEKIGEGSYGAVYKAKGAASGEIFAMKEIQTSGEKGTGYANPSRIELEASFHQALSDDNPLVAKFKAHYKQKKAQWIATELCDGGDLLEHLKNEGPFQETQIAAIAKGAVELLEACHSRNILHGDIKAANFVVSTKEDACKLRTNPTMLQDGWLKGVDFGSAMQMGKSPCTYRVGTPTHWSPEVFAMRFGLESDMWSLGTMLYQLTADRLPYLSKKEELELKDTRGILMEIISKQVDYETSAWESISEECKDFIKGLLHRQEKKRMTAKQALQHPFLTQQQTKFPAH